MKSEQNQDVMTLQRLIQLGMIATTTLGAGFLLFLGLFAAAQLSGQAAAILFLVMIGSLIAVIAGATVIHWLVQRTVSNRMMRLIDICRDYAGGDRTKRADVIGDDAFSMLSMALNTLLDSQGIDKEEQGGLSIDITSLPALQIQVERLLQETADLTTGTFASSNGTSAQALGILADSFAYLVETLAEIVQQVQEASVKTLLSTQHMRLQLSEHVQGASEDLQQLNQTTKETQSLSDFMHSVAYNVELSAQAAQHNASLAATGKEAAHQTITGLQSSLDQFGKLMSTTQRMGSNLNQLLELQATFADVSAHLTLLSQRRTPQNDSGREEESETLTLDLQHLAERANAATIRFAGLYEQILHERGSLDRELDEVQEALTRSIRLVADADRGLSVLSQKAQHSAHTQQQFAQEIQQASPQAKETALTQAQIADRLLQTYRAMRALLEEAPSLVSLAEQVQTRVSQVQLPEQLTALETGRQSGLLETASNHQTLIDVDPQKLERA